MIHLTNQNYSSRDIIQNVFSPLVGVICSPLASEICQKNNLTFVEMLQPFTRLSTDAYFHDPSGATNSIKGIRINVCDIAWRPPQTMLARKMLTDSVSTAQCEKTRVFPMPDEIYLDVPTQYQWFEQWRETFLTVQFPADHEFTRHLLSCLIVVSSSDPTPLDTAQQLTRQIQTMQTMAPPPKLPKWFMAGEILNCYVMLHDASQGADISRAQQAYESLKLTYGEHRCFLLQVNSNLGIQNADGADPWIKYLRRNPRTDQNQISGEFSAPRTPQDTGVTMLPNTVQAGSPLETPPISIMNEEVVDHPLSPVQEHATEAIHSNLSTSCESLASNLLNPNVWAGTSDAMAEADNGPHGMLLTGGDLDNLRHFVQDFTIRSLIPYVEKLVVVLNDAVTNKKGRSLLSLTKRWLGTNKPGVSSSQNSVVYTPDSVELQTRKLADLYFMFGNYNLAFHHYHQAKRDFNADSAWQFYAGALEMAALAAFMNGTSNRKTYDYMEEAIVTYLNYCKMAQFATRATLLSMECLRTASQNSEAAKQLIRMTSEDSDLRSALLLEQAAHCYLLNQPQALYRKYAFHIVLAGHRYSKSGQRRHAFRCYKQAYQVFEKRGWSLAEDHIQYTIGKQAVTLKKMDEASAALAHLLRPSSLQSSMQQAAFLREYIATQKTYVQMGGMAGNQLLDISLPKIVQQQTKVLVTPHPPVAVPGLVNATNITLNSSQENEWKWQKLEEIVVQAASKKPIMIFKPTRALFTSEMPSAESPLCIHGEPIEISFSLENTIKPSITFEDIHLLWTFQCDGHEPVSNSVLFSGDPNPEQRQFIEGFVTTSYIMSLQLNECDCKSVRIRLIPLQTGRLRVDGVVGRISATNEPNSLYGKLNFTALPIRNELPNQPIQFDRSLELEVLPPAPALHVQFSNVPSEVIAGEIIPITVTLTNSGTAALGEIYAASESPRWVLGNQQDLPLSVLKDYQDLTNVSLVRDKEARRQHSFCLLPSETQTPGIALGQRETRTTTIFVQAPLRKGPSDIKILIYYAMPDAYPKIKYRLVRHVWILNVNESLSVSVNCSISNLKTGDLGVDVTVNNLNQVHHPLMTEIYPREVFLYCPKFSLDTSSKPIFMQSPGMTRIINGSSGLRTTESLSMRIPLQETADRQAAANPVDFVKNRLTGIVVREDIAVDECVLPPFTQLNSFLMKNETKYIGVLGQTGNNEEFNQIVTDADPHMTFAITWRAIVNDNSSQQRIAFGQHFVQLRNLYETVSCPPKEKMMQPNGFASHENLVGIYDFRQAIDSNDWIDDQEDDWDDNDVSVARRCFLEVDDGTSIDDRTFQQAATVQ